MTAQFPDIIHYRGEHRALFENPLEQYFEKHPPRPDWPWHCSACWRGYIATWLVEDNRLYLLSIEKDEAVPPDNLRGGPTTFTQTSRESALVSLAAVFPDTDGRIFADWFSGELRLPEGEMLQYVHAGYGSVFERELVVEVRDGCIVSERVDEPPPGWVAEARQRQAEWKRIREEGEAEQARCDRMRTLLIDTFSKQWPEECSVDCDTFAVITGHKELAKYFNDTYEVMSQLEPLIDPEVGLWPMSQEWAEDHWDYLTDVKSNDDPRLIAYLDRFVLLNDNDEGDDYDQDPHFISGLGLTVDRQAVTARLANDMHAVLVACRHILRAPPDDGPCQP